MSTAPTESLEETPAETDAAGVIRVVGAETHNLREVDLDLPRGKLIVFCGASGSGKTSMAIDTLYAEGQRRYIESFSAYTRQFLDQLDKPAVERIEGLPPAVAVTHKNASRSNRATVATATEIADHLRLLFARAGVTYCTECGKEVRQDSVESIAASLAAAPEGVRQMVGFFRKLPERARVADAVAELIERGFVRTVCEGQTLPLDAEAAKTLPAGAEMIVVVDRLTGGQGAEGRATESVESALDAGEGACVVLSQSEERSAESIEIDGRPWRVARHSTRLECPDCARTFARPEPQLLNFNSPLGACETCEGFGSVVETDMDLVVPDRSKSLRAGAVAPWNTPAYAHELEELLALAADYDLPVDTPFEELTDEQVRLVVEGVPAREFGGLNGFFRWLERRKYKMHLRVFLSRWRSYRLCEACGGARLRDEALAVRLAGKNIAELCAMKVADAERWLAEAEFSDHQRAVGRLMLEELAARLDYLRGVGVGYLTLDRSLRTLSTGEAQRVAMTSTLGSSLVDMLYVLDEPSVGLHPADVDALSGAIARLRDRGNTVVCVEHEEEVLRRADQVVEFGPRAGLDGGEVVFQGPPNEIVGCRESRTGDWLAGRRAVRATADTRRPTDQGKLTLLGARGANLRGAEPETGLDIEFPLGVLTVVTGVSGAGKSSLVLRTLYPALERMLHSSAKESAAKNGSAKSASSNSATKSGNEASTVGDGPLAHDDLLGAKLLDDVVLIDQQPIGRSPRSNPVTYIKAFDPIRAVFADQPDAKSRGLKASHFSFNLEGGRCDACQGAGFLEIDMQFMADVYMKCRECDGRRYRPEVLAVKYRNRNIAEVLDMTAHEAFRFFRGCPKVQARLTRLLDVGLDYLQLGQPANTLSGGEAQRLKLAAHLSGDRPGAKKGGGKSAKTLFVLDEPTTGLHFTDVMQLVDCFGALLDVGHSLLVVEHNVPMMMAADWIIDLGPGASDDGGRVVVKGTPETVAACEQSATGQALAEAFARRDAAMAALDEEEEED
ncbi:UvrABC system protein A [Pseudobythopirellula maris]|uniref:UvrABC system protein A n=1 Tax=Pseudobythopirellula maris TaxID=2527991 RepID=A0A5C5ZJ29_9BACT|nr:excinuclease ABC subunit UvrA [Pseudobythopirellula maris]TWT87374.1 UvrABC system protein A [Pseudobythopirellula maris]